MNHRKHKQSENASKFIILMRMIHQIQYALIVVNLEKFVPILIV